MTEKMTENKNIFNSYDNFNTSRTIPPALAGGCSAE
jgi:hypothetical protein